MSWPFSLSVRHWFWLHNLNKDNWAASKPAPTARPPAPAPAPAPASAPALGLAPATFLHFFQTKFNPSKLKNPPE